MRIGRSDEEYSELYRLQGRYPELYKYALYVDETFSEYEEPSHLQIPDECSELFGPVNGVFYVVTRLWGPMALLNPALRQFKPLPLVQIDDPPNLDLSDWEIGFGLDPLTGDYKLVLILYFMNTNVDDQNYHCAVYVCTSDSDSWRLLEDVDPIVSSQCPRKSLCNTYLNGVYYWLLEMNDPNLAILAFDMGTEKFQATQLTGYVAQSDFGHLAMCGDSLVLLMHDQFVLNGCINVWMMKNEGCWIKTARVGPFEALPLCFWKNNELLLETMPYCFTLCNITTQELKTFEAWAPDEGSVSDWVFSYKESLVSIKGETGKCKLWDTSSDFIKDFFKNSFK